MADFRCLSLCLLVVVLVAGETDPCTPSCSPSHNNGPVCSTNGITYASECDLRRVSCSPLLGTLVAKAHDGPCQARSPHNPGIEVSVGGVGVGVGPGGISVIGLGRCRRRCYGDAYNPVCGSDGRTYDSECQFRQAQCRNQHLFIKSYGQCYVDPVPNCQHQRYCPQVYQPLCGSDGLTYSNECEFERARCRDPYLRIDYRGRCTGSQGGECHSHIQCHTHESHPVCGSDGRTYNDDCDFQHAKCRNPRLSVVYPGRCRGSPGGDCQYYEYSVCPSHSDHVVCGSDGRTYHNECHYHKAKCRDHHLHIEYHGVCRGSEGRCSFNCRGQLYPVCGNDGRTYQSYCHLKEAQCSDPRLTLRHRGSCGFVRSGLEPSLPQNLPSGDVPGSVPSLGSIQEEEEEEEVVEEEGEVKDERGEREEGRKDGRNGEEEVSDEES